MFIKRGMVAIMPVLLMVAVSSGREQTTEEFRIDTKSSKMMVHVGRSGLFAFAGHDHEVAVPAFAGQLILDRSNVSRSKLSIQFDATAMKVTGKGEPAKDVPEVQRVMLSDRVLDVERHPKIAFVSRKIALAEGSTRHNLKVRIEGELTLRGTTRPIIVPAAVRLSADRLTATGSAKVKQTLFGIKPVTAGAGTVRVKDEVEVAFTIVARPAK